jgi:hypothetical protein
MLDTGQTWQGGLPVTPDTGVEVNVVNGTGIPGAVAQTAATLKQFGFTVGTVSDAPFTADTTVSYSTPGAAGGAYALMSTLREAPLVQNGAGGPITLTLGANFTGLTTPPAPAATPVYDSRQRFVGRQESGARRVTDHRPVGIGHAGRRPAARRHTTRHTSPVGSHREPQRCQQHLRPHPARCQPRHRRDIAALRQRLAPGLPGWSRPGC